MDKGQPVFRFLAPTDTQATTFSQPTEGALNDPAPGRELGFTGARTVLKDRFTPTTAMFNVGHIPFLLDKLEDIGAVIALVKTPMLLDGIRVRAWHNNRDDHLIDQPLVMRVRAGNVDRQRSATPIDQNMNFTAALAAVYRTLACVFATQRGWTGFAIDFFFNPFVNLRIETCSLLSRAEKIDIVASG